MRSRFALLAAAVVLLAGTTPSAAAEDAAVRARIAGAMRSARSFVVTTTARTGFTVMTTFVSPDRYRSTLSYEGGYREVILIGASSWVRDGDVYRKTAAPPQVVDAAAHVRDIPIDRLLPARRIGTKTWGQFATTMAGPQKDQSLICTYDSTTFRIGQCSNEGFMMTFARYDDPLNRVDPPANVAGGSGR